MTAKKVFIPPAPSLQELSDNQARVSQALLLELARAQEELAATREKLALVRAEIEERLVFKQPVEQGPLVLVRSGSCILALERSELCEASKLKSPESLPF